MNSNETDTKKGGEEYPPEADFLKRPEWNSFGLYGARGVTGESARLVNGYRSTRYELEVLARHYMDRIGNNRFLETVCLQTSSSGQRFEVFAGRRLNTIEGILGKEATDSAIKRVVDKWDTLFAEAEAICKRKGVTSVEDLEPDDPEIEALTSAAGFITIPASELRPIEELRQILSSEHGEDGPSTKSPGQ